ncbi:MAG TPA: uroporphyrinogen-III synthase [Allocoleopsis sp.]
MLPLEIDLLTPSTKLPLYGKRIVITAPRNYAARLSAQLVNKGGLPILMPTIETCLLEDYAELDNILQQINQIDWIAFTSRNGIEAFFHRMNILDIPISQLEHCQLCAIGKDSERLSALCGRVELVPQESSPQGIVAELSQIPNIYRQTILVPAPVVVGIPEPNVVPKFISDLTQLGMNVTRVPTYTTRCLEKSSYTVELNLIRQGLIDAIAFSSTAEVESFLSMVNSTSDYEHCVIACFGPYTAANAGKLGVKVSIVAKDYSSFERFVDAIVEFFTTAS